ncbi:MAG: hypothetical protein PW789_17250 [Edaphobacter sp.]|uniref:hypothetical protein n=1 Tax=Edaphobacter sp. TaxID=1934404 RepID=UPI002390E057|nr:hypothetical protein [Edaphobacter sp.]MDE1178324.1 hypothetical protein [Edaphobacter sp.]
MVASRSLFEQYPVATFQAGFPAPVAAPISANGIIPVTMGSLAAQQLYYVPLDYKSPYVHSWNVAIQRALTYDMSMQVAYVGNRGVGIPGNIDINNPTTYGGGTASKPEYNCVGCPSGVHRTATTSKIFQGFSSNYQSLQVQLNKRFSHGFGFTSVFTWGKGLGYISGADGGVSSTPICFPIRREAALETRLDAFQLSNTPQFNNPNSGSGNIISAANFGRITGTLGSGQGSVNGIGGGRSLQASARITF